MREELDKLTKTKDRKKGILYEKGYRQKCQKGQRPLQRKKSHENSRQLREEGAKEKLKSQLEATKSLDISKTIPKWPTT